MLFKSTILAQASGSVGGSTFSHNQGGKYIRERAIPVNPNTSFQQEVRNTLANLASAWSDELTEDQRLAWGVYAANVPLVNRLGDARTVTGNAWFIKANSVRIQAGLARVDDGPVVFSLATMTAPVGTLVPASDEVSVAFTDTDGWATEVGGALLVYASRPFGPAINYFKGPYRYTGLVEGAVVPPTSPEVLDLPFPIEIGQQVGTRFVAVRADGRVSSPFLERSLAS